MANVVEIRTGFLAGNLIDVTGYDERASCERYADMLRAEIARAYPFAKVAVSYQLNASGMTPFDLQTVVYWDDDSVTHDDEEAAYIRRLKERVHERGGWAVRKKRG